MINDNRLKFGVHIPPEGKDFKMMRELCQAAENLGYDLFTITDHFMNMANPAGSGNHPLECWTSLAGLAAVTSRIHLGPLVSCVNYRHPSVLAKMATTVDIISDGRLLFGIGAGWHEMEFNGYMGRFPCAKERLDGLENAIQICRSMFTNETTNFVGKVYSAKETLNSPRPIQRWMPIMVGGSGEKRTLKIAAKYADISHLFAYSPQDLQRKLGIIRKHCKDTNRDFSEIKIAVGFRPILDSDQTVIRAQAARISSRAGLTLAEAEKTVQLTVGPRNILSAIKEYRRLGVTLLTLTGLGLGEMKSFKDQIISNLNQ
jgi:F420-dependent oxidoreductase-like protein